MHNLNLNYVHLSQGSEATTKRQETRVVSQNWTGLDWIDVD